MNPSCLEELTPTQNNQLKVSKMDIMLLADITCEGNYPKIHKSRLKLDITKIICDYQRRIQLALDQLVKSGANQIIFSYRILFWWYSVLEAARAG
jgi:hypothetical protein